MYSIYILFFDFNFECKQVIFKHAAGKKAIIFFSPLPLWCSIVLLGDKTAQFQFKTWVRFCWPAIHSMEEEGERRCLKLNCMHRIPGFSSIFKRLFSLHHQLLASLALCFVISWWFPFYSVNSISLEMVDERPFLFEHQMNPTEQKIMTLLLFSLSRNFILSFQQYCRILLASINGKRFEKCSNKSKTIANLVLFFFFRVTKVFIAFHLDFMAWFCERNVAFWSWLKHFWVSIQKWILFSASGFDDCCRRRRQSREILKSDPRIENYVLSLIHVPHTHTNRFIFTLAFT